MSLQFPSREGRGRPGCTALILLLSNLLSEESDLVPRNTRVTINGKVNLKCLEFPSFPIKEGDILPHNLSEITLAL